MKRKNTEIQRTIKIRRTYVLTSLTGLEDELDVVENYISRTCLDEAALNNFAKVFNVKLEITENKDA